MVLFRCLQTARFGGTRDAVTTHDSTAIIRSLGDFGYKGAIIRSLGDCGYKSAIIRSLGDCGYKIVCSHPELW